MVTDVLVTCTSFYRSKTPLPFRRQCNLSLCPGHLNLTIYLINLGCLHTALPLLCQIKPATFSKVLTVQARAQPYHHASSNLLSSALRMGCDSSHPTSLIPSQELLHSWSFCFMLYYALEGIEMYRVQLWCCHTWLYHGGWAGVGREGCAPLSASAKGSEQQR